MKTKLTQTFTEFLNEAWYNKYLNAPYKYVIKINYNKKGEDELEVDYDIHSSNVSKFDQSYDITESIKSTESTKSINEDKGNYNKAHIIDIIKNKMGEDWDNMDIDVIDEYTSADGTFHSVEVVVTKR